MLGARRERVNRGDVTTFYQDNEALIIRAVVRWWMFPYWIYHGLTKVRLNLNSPLVPANLTLL
jgi:hypothetical protein